MIRSKAITLCLCAVLFSLSASFQACSSLNKTAKGTALGSAAGGAIGAMIGKKAGNPAIGATIGAALGGSTGAFIGNKLTRTPDSVFKKPVAVLVKADTPQQTEAVSAAGSFTIASPDIASVTEPDGTNP